MGKPQSLALAFMLAVGSVPATGLAAELPAAAGPAQTRSQVVTITAGAPLPDIGKDVCPLLPEFTEGVELDHVKAALRPGGRLGILVIGSGTVLGPELDNPDASFPYRMARALKAASPATEITLNVQGGKGLTAGDMVGMITRDLAAASYQLVLWQTATVEAVKGLPVDALSDSLAAGIEQVAAAGSDLILVDPQYSRFLRANANLEPYQQALEQAAAEPDVSLFHRFDLMHAWVDSGGIDLERAAPGDRQKVADMLHACLGRALAQLIMNAAGLEGKLSQ